MIKSGNMNATPNPNQSFFSIAAWYSLVASLVAAALLGISWKIEIPDRNSYSLADVTEGAACLAAITSALASIVSLFGVRRHGWRVIVWKSLVGFVLSYFVFGELFNMGMRALAQVSRQ